MVPLGERYIALRLKLLHAPSSGVMVAHFTDADLLDHLGRVDRDLVFRRVAVLHAEIEISERSKDGASFYGKIKVKNPWSSSTRRDDPDIWQLIKDKLIHPISTFSCLLFRSRHGAPRRDGKTRSRSTRPR